MTDKELLNMVLKDNSFEKEAALSISEQISKELEKSAPDYNKISELSRNYADLIDTDEDIILRSEEHTQKILDAARKYSPKKRFFRRFLGIAASLVLITFSANCYTVAALNMNIFKAIVHFANKGFSVEFTSEEEINNDPYGIKAECAKYDIFPEAPTYLPHEIDYISSEYEEYAIENSIVFYYGKDEAKLTICYDVFFDPDDINAVKYPSDEFNVKNITINNKPAVTSKEDGQFTLVYSNNNILMTIFTQNIPYYECDKIIESIK